MALPLLPLLLLWIQRQQRQSVAQCCTTGLTHPAPACPTPRSVYLLPPSIGCNWVGLGYVGCDGSFRCRVWISGDFWMTAQARNMCAVFVV